MTKKLAFWQSSAFPGGFLFTVIFSLSPDCMADWGAPWWKRELTPSSLCIPTNGQLQGPPPWRGAVPPQFGCLFVSMGVLRYGNFLFSGHSGLGVFCLLVFSLLVNRFFFFTHISSYFFLPIGGNGLVEIKGRN